MPSNTLCSLRVCALAGLTVLVQRALLCQPQDTGVACSGISIAFENSSGGVATTGLSVAFQDSSGGGVATTGLSVAFRNTPGELATSGLSVSFQTALNLTGRGVTVSFGTSPPPTSPPPATTSLGTSSSVNQVFMSSEPVNTATGDYFKSVTDLSVPGRGLDFTFTRAYNSQDSYAGPFGANWTHSYNISLTVDGSGNVGIKQADGHTDYYTPAGGGAYTAQTIGLFNALVKNGDGSFTLTFKNQTTFHFSSAGVLLTIVDRNGNTQTLAYNGSGNLASVTDPSGRVFSYAYDGSGRVISLTDPAGRTLHYAYDGSGNLVSFQDALGHTTQYAYDAGHHMTSATDPRGNVYMQNVYDSNNPSRVVLQANARGFQTSFAYNTDRKSTRLNSSH